MPGISRDEVLVTIGVILVLLAILVPVVRKVHETARRAAQMQRQAVDPVIVKE